VHWFQVAGEPQTLCTFGAWHTWGLNTP